MPGPAKVILVEADPAANAALRFGLSRAGLEVSSASDAAAVAEAASSAGLVLISDGNGGAKGAELVGAVRASLEDAELFTPILFVESAKLDPGGRGEDGPSDEQISSRRAVERAGAWEVLRGPQALRDIANVARIMLCDRRNDGWAGNLLEISGVFGLVRALSALGRSGVLTLTRGVRRGEVRYFHGEITSAQVGMIHGQAAFHQLLLWTDAKFDFRGEIIVRRRQIPLTPAELLADAERFLESTRDIAGGLSPSVVLDVVPDKLTALAIKIPPEVHAILNMFDGRRNLVDVLEDSPYRVHDTLRVARKGFETKVLKAVPPHKARPNWKAVASLEHWLLGEQPVVPREVRSTGVVTGIDEGETLKMPAEQGGAQLAGEGRVTISGTVAAIAASAISGGAAGSTSAGYDVDVTEKTLGRNGSGGVSVGVAVTVTSWRDLTALDWSELVPRSSGLEIPMLSPVVPATKTKGEIDAVEAADPASAQAQQQGSGRSVIVSEDAIISPEERAEEERKIAARKAAEEAAAAKAAAETAEKKAAEEKAAAEAAEKKAAEEKAAAEAAEKKAAEEKAAAEKAAAEAAENKAAEEKAAAEAAEKKAAEESAAAEARAAAEKAAAEKKAAEEKAAAEESAAAEKAAAEKKAAEEKAAAEAKAAEEKAAAEAKAVEEKAAADKAASEKAAAEAEEKAVAERAAAEKAAAEKAAAEKLAAEAADRAAAEKAAAEKAAAEKAAIEKAAAEKASQEKSAARPVSAPIPDPDDKTSKINRRPTTADVLPKNSKKRDRKKGGKPGADSAPVAASASGSSPGSSSGSAPRESQQDLSQTAKLGPQATAANPLIKHPRSATAPVGEEPSVLVADLQAAHTAVSAHAKAQAAAASSPDAGGNFDAVVQQVKSDASKATAAFTADEEAFFQAGGHAAAETFADLDAGYRPRTFWQRLLGRGKTNH